MDPSMMFMGVTWSLAALTIVYKGSFQDMRIPSEYPEEA